MCPELFFQQQSARARFIVPTQDTMTSMNRLSAREKELRQFNRARRVHKKKEFCVDFERDGKRKKKKKVCELLDSAGAIKRP